MIIDAVIEATRMIIAGAAIPLFIHLICDRYRYRELNRSLSHRNETLSATNQMIASEVERLVAENRRLDYENLLLQDPLTFINIKRKKTDAVNPNSRMMRIEE